MGNVFVTVGMSLDGFIAGPNRGPSNPLGDRGALIHQWIYKQQAFRQQLGLGGDGETGRDNELLAATFARIGANIMGKRMFEEGEQAWPENAPFHTPVFVLSHERRPAWPRPGGTTFHFVDGALEHVLEEARAAAGERDVRISGGAEIICKYLDAGLVDELNISLTPVVQRVGLRLFDGLTRPLSLTLVETVASATVTHLRYRVG
ncbi:MAG TPA: dihydrofolate reductase family protein [Nannocystaceae bacterium]|nr:dihydrofolate reductase family protein [Nannocystaceae bacterium]